MSAPGLALLRLAARLDASSWRSGQDLATELGCSRAAVWKQVEGLRRLGVDVDAEKGRGYRLAEPLELLDRAKVLAACGPAVHRLCEPVILPEADSTNDAVLRFPTGQRHGRAVLAEQQSSGRGRRGRPWHSPFGRNIYLSLGWRFDTRLRDLASLPLAVAVAASRALQGVGLAGQGVKWPNDLLLDGAKLGGCLVEVRGDVNGPCLAVLGVGINVRMVGAVAPEAIDQPWTDVASHQPEVSRNQLAGSLLAELVVGMDQFSERGFGAFLAEWEQLDAVAGRRITLRRGAERINGRARGVSVDGGLLLETGGKVKEFHAGEVTFRA